MVGTSRKIRYCRLAANAEMALMSLMGEMGEMPRIWARQAPLGGPRDLGNDLTQMLHVH